MFDDLIKEIEKYYTRRGLVWPDKKDALLWLTTELGELIDSTLRLELNWVRNSEKSVDMASEVADVLLMLLVFCKATSIDPVEALLEKMERKLKELGK